MKVRKGIPPMGRVALYEGNEPHPSTTDDEAPMTSGRIGFVTMDDYLEACMDAGELQLKLDEMERVTTLATSIAANLAIFVQDIYHFMDIINDDTRNLFEVSEAASVMIGGLTTEQANVFRLIAPLDETGLIDNLRARYIEMRAEAEEAEKSND